MTERKGFPLLARLISGHICLHASMAGMRLAAPLFALSEGYSAAAVGLLLALFSLAQVFLAIPMGRYADRHGLKRPIGWGVIFACVGAAFAGVYPHFITLCLAAVSLGGSSGISSIALQRYVGRSATDSTQLKQAFSWLSVGPAISNFLGPVIAGVLIDYAGIPFGGSAGDANGFRIAFLMTAVLPLGTWLFVRRVAELPPMVATQGSTTGNLWRLLQNAPMRRLLVVNWLLSSCWDVHTFVVPILGHERGFSASVIGTILGGFAVAAVCVRLVMPMLASHLREGVVVASAMISTAVLFALYPWMQSPWGMGLCSILLGLALGSVQPMIMSTLHQITPHALHGQAIALRLVTINLSSVLMPILFGTAGALIGVSAVFWTAGALVGLGARSALRLNH